ncbi:MULTISPECIES: GNAT family N-acetyltransferase [unclassified Novosphingobium]|uniref:GNAT family N-acetyltransferase n=1 Tax=unclassified Novosphingobium TaxID=2644732 RepID=UPI000EC90F44|nr:MULTISPECIES: GNAT family N-acetyltransferase [unclassified Novosphingobium]HCF24300.1 ribosomal-protein-alanine acetyltransferase [Novosphingobium sp.]HQV04882.1 GNAT family N-acetyltransferase [Novosphingobium sp.]
MIAPRDDIDRIMAVMQAAFAPEFGEAWSRRQVEDALLVGNCHYGLVASHGDEPLAGEPAAGFYLSRAGYEEEELLLLAVLPEQRRKGLANYLLDSLKSEALLRGAKQLFLEMRRGNPAESLYRACGFTPIGERINYYRTPTGERLDAITFCCKIQ